MKLRVPPASWVMVALLAWIGYELHEMRTHGQLSEAIASEYQAIRGIGKPTEEARPLPPGQRPWFQSDGGAAAEADIQRWMKSERDSRASAPK